MLRASLNVYEHFTPDSERLYHGDRRIAVLVIDHALLCVPNQPSRLSRSPNIITHARGGRTTAGPWKPGCPDNNALTLETLMVEVVRLIACCVKSLP